MPSPLRTWGVIAAFVPDGAPITVVVDDTLFHRYGKKVAAAFWQHDGSARGRDGLGRGNCSPYAPGTATRPTSASTTYRSPSAAPE